MKATTSKTVVRVGIVGGLVGGIIYLLGRKPSKASSLPELPAEFKKRRGAEAPPEPVEKEPSRVATTRGSYR
jgi:hypothetical protein